MVDLVSAEKGASQMPGLKPAALIRSATYFMPCGNASLIDSQSPTAF